MNTELWEHCNTRSQAALIQLYWQEHRRKPDFYYVMKGETPPEPGEINAPDYQEQNIQDVNQEMESNSDIKGKIK